MPSQVKYLTCKVDAMRMAKLMEDAKQGSHFLHHGTPVGRDTNLGLQLKTIIIQCLPEFFSCCLCGKGPLDSNHPKTVKLPSRKMHIYVAISLLSL